MSIQIYRYEPKKNEAFYAIFGLISRTVATDFLGSETAFVVLARYDDNNAGTPVALTLTNSIAAVSPATAGLYGLKFTASEMDHTLIVVKIENTNAYDVLLEIRPYDAVAEYNRMADHFHRRSTANVEASTATGLDALSYKSHYGAVASIAHRWYPSGSNLIITKADDTTTLATRPAATDGNALPLTGIGAAT